MSCFSWLNKTLVVYTCIGACMGGVVQAAQLPPKLPHAVLDQPEGSSGHEQPGSEKLESVVLAGGCFWGVQAVFEHVKGVKQVISGYAGGEAATANYETVSSGESGHAESVKIQFSPGKVSFGELLRIYFSVAHNPTELNRQGPDSGTQYRSAIFYTTPEQQRIAQAYIRQLQQAKIFSSPIVTQLSPLKAFYKAEDEHQDFFIRHPNHPYIVYHDVPKIHFLKELFPERFQEKPVALKPSQYLQ